MIKAGDQESSIPFRMTMKLSKTVPVDQLNDQQNKEKKKKMRIKEDGNQ